MRGLSAKVSHCSYGSRSGLKAAGAGFAAKGGKDSPAKCFDLVVSANSVAKKRDMGGGETGVKKRISTSTRELLVT